jgi:hypothetical protein
VQLSDHSSPVTVTDNAYLQSYSRLGGVMVSVLAIVLKVYGFIPGQGDGLLRVITIRGSPSFGGK